MTGFPQAAKGEQGRSTPAGVAASTAPHWLSVVAKPRRRDGNHIQYAVRFQAARRPLGSPRGRWTNRGSTRLTRRIKAVRLRARFWWLLEWPNDIVSVRCSGRLPPTRSPMRSQRFGRCSCYRCLGARISPSMGSGVIPKSLTRSLRSFARLTVVVEQGDEETNSGR